MLSDEEKIKVMQHFVNGGEIEYKKSNSLEWKLCTSPSWNWVVSNYRIKG